MKLLSAMITIGMIGSLAIAGSAAAIAEDLDLDAAAVKMCGHDGAPGAGADTCVNCTLEWVSYYYNGGTAPSCYLTVGP